MDIQTATIVVTGIGVLIAAVNQIYISRQTNEQRERELETRQAELFTNIYNRWNSREFIKAYGSVRYAYKWRDFDEFVEKYMPEKNVEEYADFMTLGTFFEGLGVLVKKGLIDIGLVQDLVSERIIWYYKNVVGPMIDGIRKLTNDPTQWDHVEYLYHEMRHRQRLTVRL